MPSNMILPSSHSRTHSRNSSGNSVTFGSGGLGVYGRRSNTMSPTRPTPIHRNPRVVRLAVGVGSLLSVAAFILLYGGRHQGAYVGSLPKFDPWTGEDADLDGGLVIGANGNFYGTAGSVAESNSGSSEGDTPAITATGAGADDILNEYGWPIVDGKGSWPGYTSELAKALIDGLDPSVPNPSFPEPLSGLGEEADNTYIYGPNDLEEYTHSLQAFIKHAFPHNMQRDLLSGLELYTTANDTDYLWLDGLGGKEGWKNIWMTDKDKKRLTGSKEVLTWKGNADGWGFKFLDDWEMEKWVTHRMKGSNFGRMWDALPLKILKADTLRYLLLCISGGVYSDIDTKLLKGIPEWGKNADFWNGGEGWLGEEAARDVRKKWKNLPPPSVVIGIEADVGDREDWHKWWPRPLQIVQWTLGSTPHHPIFIDVLQGILRSTSKAITWDVSQKALVNKLRAEGKEEEAAKVEAASVKDEPNQGGPVGVMNWTGPGVWTDAVMRYLRVRYGVQWTDLRNLRTPLRVGEVVILPVTGFSPNVGLFGAKSFNDPQAMVEHSFAGTWKGQDD